MEAPTIIDVTLEGVAPIMFDKFIDHSKDDRPPEQKLYLDTGNKAVIPAENIYSFLFGENPQGAIRAMQGKQGKEGVRYGQSHILIDPVLIPFLDENGKQIIFSGFENGKFAIWLSAPRTKSGSLSIKQEIKPRPYLKLPWLLELKITLIKNIKIDSIKLENWFRACGITIGLGTYRPRFGRFIVTKWKEK